MTNLKKVAILTSLSGGLGHYAAHLSGPLSKEFSIKFISYPQLDSSGTTVKQITDSLVRQYIKWPRFDLDDKDPISIVSILEYINSHDIDLINIHIGTTVKEKVLYFISLCLYAKTFHRKKFVFTLHDVLPFEENKKLIKLLKVFYNLGDYFTVGNEEEKKKLIKYFQISEAKISIIPHGIYNLFNKKVYTQNFARSYLGIPQDKKVLLFFGWLRPYKGFEYLVQAVKIMLKKDPNFIIYVASGLKYTPKSLLEKYFHLMKRYGVQDQFVLNLNYLDSLEVEAVFQASDAVILPYTHVSQSGVEQMAFGFKKPVVVTDVFPDKTWINKKAGLIAKTADATDIADKLLELISDPQRMIEYGEFGYQYSMENFNWELIAGKYAAVYHKVLTK